MKVLSVVGTRPNIIKEYLINRELLKRGVEEVLVHTGQHYDYEMSQIFFEDFGLPQPHYHFDIPNESNIVQTAEILRQMEQVLLHEKPTLTLVYGDVNSTLAAALASAKLRIPVVHIEGGVRTLDLYNPEEINRRGTDALSQLIFACTKTGYENLLKENFSRNRICLSGDLMMDVLLHTVRARNIAVERNDYMVATIHREENVESKDRLTRIILAFGRSGARIVFPAHPRTRKKLADYGLVGLIAAHRNVELCSPMGYTDFLKLLAGANKVITDSGGVRREAYVLHKPVIVLLDLVWFPEILQAGWKVIADDNEERIVDAILNFEPPCEHPAIFGDGQASHRIVDVLIERFA